MIFFFVTVLIVCYILYVDKGRKGAVGGNNSNRNVNYKKFVCMALTMRAILHKSAGLIKLESNEDITVSVQWK